MIKQVALTLGMLTAIGGCHQAQIWQGLFEGIIVGAGQTVGAFLANLVLGRV